MIAGRGNQRRAAALDQTGGAFAGNARRAKLDGDQRIVDGERIVVLHKNCRLAGASRSSSRRCNGPDSDSPICVRSARKASISGRRIAVSVTQSSKRSINARLVTDGQRVGRRRRRKAGRGTPGDRAANSPAQNDQRDETVAARGFDGARAAGARPPDLPDARQPARIRSRRFDQRQPGLAQSCTFRRGAPSRGPTSRSYAARSPVCPGCVRSGLSPASVRAGPARGLRARWPRRRCPSPAG